MTTDSTHVGMKAKALACVAAGAIALAALAGCGGNAASSAASSAAESAQSAQESSAAMEANDVMSSSAASGASSASASASAESASSASSKAAAKLEIGEDSEDAKTMTITNDLGDQIVDIAIVATGAEAAPGYLMKAGQEWKSGDQAVVHFADAGEGVNYDIYVTAGENNYVLHNMALDGVDELAMEVENGIAYATFERDGNAISTLSEETDYAEQGAAEDSGTDEGSYDGGEEYYEEPAYEEPAQQEDGCVDGGVQLR